MRKFMLSGKIHRATITDANINYVGSILIDKRLMKAAKIEDYEQVHIWNITRGSRLVTYAIESENKGEVCVNGSAVHLNYIGDLIIIASFALIGIEEELYSPNIVCVDKNNDFLEERVL